jgi:hypothetical protein
MNKYDEIKGYEDAIKVLQNEINKLKNDPMDKATVKRGDFIICTASVEWSYSKGDRMWVDSVHPGHILVRSENPKYRDSYVFWCSNSDWVKE